MSVADKSRAREIGCALRHYDASDYSTRARFGLYAHDLCTAIENKQASTNMFIAIADPESIVNFETGVFSQMKLSTHRLAAGELKPLACWKEFNLGTALTVTESAASTSNINITGEGTNASPNALAFTGATSVDTKANFFMSLYLFTVTLQTPCTLDLTKCSLVGNSVDLTNVPIGTSQFLIKITAGETTGIVLTLTPIGEDTTDITGIVHDATGNNAPSNFISCYPITPWTVGQANMVF